MISVPLIVGILLTCLTPDMAIPEVWITDKPPFCCPAPAKKTASCTCLVTSSHAENEDCITKQAMVKNFKKVNSRLDKGKKRKKQMGIPTRTQVFKVKNYSKSCVKQSLRVPNFLRAIREIVRRVRLIKQVELCISGNRL